MSASGSEDKAATGRSSSSRPADDEGTKLRYDEPASGCAIGCAEVIAVLLVIAGSAVIVLLLGI